MNAIPLGGTREREIGIQVNTYLRRQSRGCDTRLMRSARALVCVIAVLGAHALFAQSLAPLPDRQRPREPATREPDRRAPREPAPREREPRTRPVEVAGSSGIWIDRATIAALPTRGVAWSNLVREASRECGTPELHDQDDGTNVCVMAKALVSARTGNARFAADVRSALRSIVDSGTYRGRALSLGRELAAYVIAADIIGLRAIDRDLDERFRVKIRQLLTTPTTDGPRNLVECHERRPNNWGNHCGASRAAVAAYLGDSRELARAAQVFKGYLGDRASYAGFRYGDLAWQCHPRSPVGINPKGCVIDGHSLDGVLPDDQRRSGKRRWPPPHENYVYEGLQGALAQAVILHRAGFDAFDWGDQALLRAVRWLYHTAHYEPVGDDTWIPYVVNYYYGTDFPAPESARTGKNVGWTNWTHQRDHRRSSK